MNSKIKCLTKALGIIWLRNQQAYSVRKQIHTGTKSKITSAGFNYMWDLDLADVSNIKQYNDVKGYNHRKHSRLHGFSPAEINEDTQYLLWRKIYAQKPKKEYKFEIGDIAYLRKQPVKILARFRRNTYKNMYQLLSLSNKTELKGSFDEKELRKSLRKRSLYKFKIGDLVRITHKQRSFKRGYHQKWTEEVFKISNRYLRNGKPIYKIEDLDDEPIEGFFL
ncbi:hypothetical protein KUTeg_002886 [Tegillarca granosa]|uniref:Uncharacterized protein n=1 Tax=Tegillarca granosa TaxID=220873 RepID=A0ABQ9FSA1_TEGGR|nr:hypothetical protein KUTeg_002886 [Tegillarca granosa]